MPGINWAGLGWLFVCLVSCGCMLFCTWVAVFYNCERKLRVHTEVDVDIDIDQSWRARQAALLENRLISITNCMHCLERCRQDQIAELHWLEELHYLLYTEVDTRELETLVR